MGEQISGLYIHSHFTEAINSTVSKASESAVLARSPGTAVLEECDDEFGNSRWRECSYIHR